MEEKSRGNWHVADFERQCAITGRIPGQIPWQTSKVKRYDPPIEPSFLYTKNVLIVDRGYPNP